MKVGSAERKGQWWKLGRDLAVTACVAVLVALAASRINRPQSREVDPALPGFLWLQVPEVTLDLRSFPQAVESLRQVAPAPIEVDWPEVESQGLLLRPDHLVQREIGASLTLRGLTMGQALAILGEEFNSEAGLSYRLLPDRIILSRGTLEEETERWYRRMNTSPPPKNNWIVRIYDLSALARRARAWRERMARPCGIDRERVEQVSPINFIPRWCKEPGRASMWGDRLVLQAPPRTHWRLQSALMMLDRAEERP